MNRVQLVNEAMDLTQKILNIDTRAEVIHDLSVALGSAQHRLNPLDLEQSTAFSRFSSELGAIRNHLWKEQEDYIRKLRALKEEE